MALPPQLAGKLRLPLVAAPMFLGSGPELVIACCRAGILGTFPALNQRSSEGFDQWLSQIGDALADSPDAAPFGVNLVVHKSNPRLKEDLEICVKHKVPLVITSLGAAHEVVERIHSYGGLVFHDVVNLRFAKKAASVGVDGLIAVAKGAGGHAGDWNPFALVNEIRGLFDKTLLLSGCLSTGRDIATAQMMGADLAYMGTRFLSTQEAMVQQEYKQMITDTSAADIVYTPLISGVPASFMQPSLDAAGIELDKLSMPTQLDFGAELDHANSDEKQEQAKPWKEIWSAGQGVGSIADIPTTAELVTNLAREYHEVRQQFCSETNHLKI